MLFTCPDCHTVDPGTYDDNDIIRCSTCNYVLTNKENKRIASYFNKKRVHIDFQILDDQLYKLSTTNN